MPSGSRIWLALVLVGQLLAVGAARADAVAEAKAHFDKGRALYQAGQFRQALTEFKEGYRLAPRPMFLANIGQAHRQLYELDEAREAYRAFLKEAPANDPFRPQVEQIIADLDRAIASRPSPSPSPRPETTLVQAAPAPPPKTPFIRRHWWIIPVAAVAAAGIGVGIYFGARPPERQSCGDLALGCVTVTP